jgi:hypothetical protein
VAVVKGTGEAHFVIEIEWANESAGKPANRATRQP